MEKNSSRILDDAVDAFASLPGIGRKTALRLALHCIYQAPSVLDNFASSVSKLGSDLKFCRKCHHVSDADICHICTDQKRDRKTICIVESIRDVMAIEDTGHYRGLYHVLGGIISPIDGVGPDDLNIETLVNRCIEDEIDEVIMGISPTIDGETTIYYLTRCLNDAGVDRISILARGVAFGGELEYADEMTLGRSIRARIPYQVNE